MRINQVLIKAKITEKGLDKVKDSVYLFEVNRKANKHQIKEAVEKLFKVVVDEVKTTIRKGKKRRVGRRMKTKKLPAKKLAYVKLKKGKIDIFPQR